mmetsp:Transcript_13315/g.37639  ORF Transcript_13315/g.37639 Transcript_13315/m.37639 type:complete len:253 (-) Transcript_13315:115-873(-)
MGGRGPSHTLVGVVAPVEAPASADIRLDLTCQCPIPAVEEPGGPWVPPSWAGPRGVGPDAARHGGPPRAQRPPRKHPSPNYLAPPPPCRAGTPLSATGGPHGAHPCHVGWGPVSHDPQGVPLQTSSARAGLLPAGHLASHHHHHPFPGGRAHVPCPATLRPFYAECHPSLPDCPEVHHHGHAPFPARALWLHLRGHHAQRSSQTWGPRSRHPAPASCMTRAACGGARLPADSSGASHHRSGSGGHSRRPPPS